MVLASILDKIVTEFDEVMRKWRQERTSQIHIPVTRHGLPTPTTLSPPASVTNSGPHGYFDGPQSAGRRLFLGDYELDSSEWAPLLKTLITLYARRLELLITRCKEWATATDRRVMLAMFFRIERRFRDTSAAY